MRSHELIPPIDEIIRKIISLENQIASLTSNEEKESVDFVEKRMLLDNMLNYLEDNLTSKLSIAPAKFAEIMMDAYFAENYEDNYPNVLKSIICIVDILPTFAYARAINNCIVKNIVEYSRLNNEKKGTQRNPLSFLKVLISGGLNPGEICGNFKESYTFLHVAIAVGNKEIFDYLLPIYAESHLLETPGIMLKDTYKLQCASLEDGGTLLSVACELHNIDMMAALISEGADINSRSLTLKTPLWFAVLKYKIPNRLAAVKLLLANKADPSLPENTANGTPYTLAKSFGNANDNEEIKTLLASYKFMEIDQLIENTKNIFEIYKINSLQDGFNSNYLRGLQYILIFLNQAMSELQDRLIASYKEFYEETSDKIGEIYENFYKSIGIEKYVSEVKKHIVRYGLHRLLEKLIENNELDCMALLNFNFELTIDFIKPDIDTFGFNFISEDKDVIAVIDSLNTAVNINNNVLNVVHNGIYSMLKEGDVDPYMFAYNLFKAYSDSYVYMIKRMQKDSDGVWVISSDYCAKYLRACANAVSQIIRFANECEDVDDLYIEEITRYIYYQIESYKNATGNDKIRIENAIKCAVGADLRFDVKILYEIETDFYISIFDFCVIKSSTTVYESIKYGVEYIENKISSQNNATPLIIAAKNHCLPIFYDLIARPAKINAVTDDNETAIYLVTLDDRVEVLKTRIEIIKTLILNNADLTIPSKNGTTVFNALSHKRQRQLHNKQVFYMLNNPDLIRYIYREFKAALTKEMSKIIDEFCDISAVYQTQDGVELIEVDKNRISSNKKLSQAWPDRIMIDKIFIEKILVKKKDVTMHIQTIIFDILVDLYPQEKAKFKPRNTVTPVIAASSSSGPSTLPTSAPQPRNTVAQVIVANSSSNPSTPAPLLSPTVKPITRTKMLRASSDPLPDYDAINRLALAKQEEKRKTAKFLAVQKRAENDKKKADKKALQTQNTTQNKSQPSASSTPRVPATITKMSKPFKVCIPLTTDDKHVATNHIESKSPVASTAVIFASLPIFEALVDITEFVPIVDVGKDGPIAIVSEAVVQGDESIESEAVVEVDNRTEEDFALESLEETTARVLREIFDDEEKFNTEPLFQNNIGNVYSFSGVFFYYNVNNEPQILTEEDVQRRGAPVYDVISYT